MYILPKSASIKAPDFYLLISLIIRAVGNAHYTVKIVFFLFELPLFRLGWYMSEIIVSSREADVVLLVRQRKSHFGTRNMSITDPGCNV